MTELRKKMIECLQLRGFSERTQEAYTRAVRQLAEHYHKSPDLITEEELRQPSATTASSSLRTARSILSTKNQPPIRSSSARSPLKNSFAGSCSTSCPTDLSSCATTA